MIEIPEAFNLAKQLNETVLNKKIKDVQTLTSPHKFCFFRGDHTAYCAMMSGKTISNACYFGGHVEFSIEGLKLDINDGVNLQYFASEARLPTKHQLLISFEDGSSLVGRVQMYGGISLFKDSCNDNFYYLVAKEKPNPLSEDFSNSYFSSLLASIETIKLTTKAFLATEQRIPGLGNGTLQDILWRSHIHPKSKISALSSEETDGMFNSVKTTLGEMAQSGGRDTERDLFGHNGGYITIMSKNNISLTCPTCGGSVKKEAYLGGSVYFCANCQPIKKI